MCWKICWNFVWIVFTSAKIFVFWTFSALKYTFNTFSIFVTKIQHFHRISDRIFCLQLLTYRPGPCQHCKKWARLLKAINNLTSWKIMQIQATNWRFRAQSLRINQNFWKLQKWLQTHPMVYKRRLPFTSEPLARFSVVSLLVHLNRFFH